MTTKAVAGASLVAGLALGVLADGALRTHTTAVFLIGVLAGLALGAYLRWVDHQ